MKNTSKSLSNKSLILLVSFCLSLFAFFYFRTIYSDAKKISLPFSISRNANFSISSPQKVILGQAFKVVVSLDTDNSTVNAVGVNINYEGNKLRVVSLDTTQSFCQFYPEKRHNNNIGKIYLSCGSPSPGFSGKNDVLVIEFKPIKIGDTPISLDPQSKILLSDGKGTNVLKDFPQTRVKIINSL